MMCRRATSSGYEYFSSACAGFDYQGLNARQYGTYRKTTVDKILELAMVRLLQYIYVTLQVTDVVETQRTLKVYLL